MAGRPKGAVSKQMKAVLPIIETRYRSGDTISQIATDLCLPDQTVAYHVRINMWERDLVDKFAEMKALKDNLLESVSTEVRPAVEQKMATELDLNMYMRSFFEGAVKTNLRNLQEVSKIEDVNLRVKLIKSMDCTMKDLITVVREGERPDFDKLVNESSIENNDSKVVIYIPDNERPRKEIEQ